MTAQPSGSALATRLAAAQPKTRRFLRVVRHGGGPQADYIVTFHRLEMPTAAPVPPAKPVLAEGAHALIELLERIGVDFNLREVRGALEDVLRFGSANIPDLWLSDEEILEKGLVDS